VGVLNRYRFLCVELQRRKDKIPQAVKTTSHIDLGKESPFSTEIHEPPLPETRVLARTIHTRCIYGIFGRKVTKYTVTCINLVLAYPITHTQTHTQTHTHTHTLAHTYTHTQKLFGRLVWSTLQSCSKSSLLQVV
jgi:hypothetical protein